MHFGLRCVPLLDGGWRLDRHSEFQYSIPFEQLISGRDRRCVWCAFVYEEYLKRRSWGERRETVKIEMVWRHSPGDQYDVIEDCGMFRVDVDEGPVYRGLVCTAPGASK